MGKGAEREGKRRKEGREGEDIDGEEEEWVPMLYPKGENHT